MSFFFFFVCVCVCVCVCCSIVESIGVWGVHLGVLYIGRQVVGWWVVVIFGTNGTVVFFSVGRLFLLLVTVFQSGVLIHVSSLKK